MAEPDRFDAEDTARRYQLLVNAVSDYAIYMLDADGYILTWNPGAERFKGYSADEIIGAHFSRFFTEADRAAGVPGAILATAAAEGRYENEAIRVRKDGVRIWVHVVIDPIREADGHLVGFAKITRDVSAKREADRALFESEQRFRHLVQGVRDYAIYMLDLDGRITNWNTGAALIKGYGADEVVGKHFSLFYTDEDRAAGIPAKALETALREGHYECEAQRVRKDGMHFWASVVIDPIRDENGTLIGFAKITRDISEKRRAQEELDEARTALMQSQKLQAIGELTGGIAHDFNNLMTVVRGSAELLEKPDLSVEKRLRYARTITDTADRATALTAKLLAFGRRQSLIPEVIDLAVRLDAFGEVLARTLGSRIQVKLDVATDVWSIEADVTELETALLNAAINARDAMPNGGTITIAAHNMASEDAVCLSIADTGEGIAPDVLARVFEPFFTTKPVGKGTGLGLSQIHGFAAQSGGHAGVRSTVGEGTVVSLVLPRTTKMPAATADRIALTSWECLNVLVVEDNDGVRQFATTMLRELNSTVTEAASAEKALALLARDRFDIVFTDIVMPGMSGLELARHLRKTMPDQPVLLTTGYSREVADGQAAGFVILKKPYGAESLSTAIARALSG
jgi:PAS domain S-box-containing protein